MPDNDVIKLVEQLRKAIIAQDTEVMERLGRAYAGIYQELEKRVASLVEVISNMETPPTGAQLGRLETYKLLMKEVTDQLTKFQNYAEIELGTSARAAIIAGAEDAASLATAAGFRGSFMRLNPAAIEQMIGFLKTDGALFGRLKMLAPTTAEAVSQAFINAVALGDNPRTIAASLISTFKSELGQSLVDVLRMTRTTQIWAYREANRASYIANSDVVTGWIWFAELDGACMGCYAMHGTEHPLTETLDDHYNGRCTMVPITILNPNPNWKKGEEWFNELTPEEQEKRMGPGKYEAWKAGKFTFDQLATHSDNEVYGSMTTETPLKDLLDMEPQQQEYQGNVQDSVDASLASVREYGKETGKESMVFIDEKGNIIDTITGTGDKVNIPDEIKQRIFNDEQITTVHDHPIPAVPSPQDIGLFSGMGGEHYIVDPDYKYTITFGDRLPVDKAGELRDSWAKDIVKAEIEAQKAQREIDLGWSSKDKLSYGDRVIETEHDHLTNFADKNGFGYSREKY
jgi:hypothetical protein